MSATTPSHGAAGQTERRVHHKVREVFTEACALIAPSLGKGRMPDATIADMLRLRYPELSALEIHVLVTAAARAHARLSGA
ncbi:MAG: hypothetical protein ACUVT2_02265 [Thiobacillaceae bacterium]